MNFMKIKKVILKLQSKIVRYKKIKNPVVYMTLLVKNEEDILEENIIFHHEMGVNGFIVTDNGSRDKTAEIINKYKQKGWIKELIYDETGGHQQVKFVDKMIRIAKEKYHADWIINCDADEFWYCKKGKYQDILSNCSHNVLKCAICNMIPIEDDVFWKSKWKIVNTVDSEEYNIPFYNLYTKQMEKVIHRLQGYKIISAGNHNVKIKLKSIGQTNDIVIYHYNVRNKEHFIRKMIHGGKELSKVENNMGEHWKYFYELSKKEGFDEDTIYNNFIGKNHFQMLKKSGVIVKDLTIIKFFEILDKEDYEYV